MKEFVVLNEKNEVIDRASLRENLTKDGSADTQTIEFEGNLLIGDKIESGKVIEVSTGNSERAKINQKREDSKALKTKLRANLKSGKLDDDDIDNLFKMMEK